MARRIRRKLGVLLVTLGIVAAGVVVEASPAAAAVSIRFSGPTVSSGTATFINSYSVQITATVYGDVSGPGYLVEAQYLADSSNRTCGTRRHTATRTSGPTTYTDTMTCLIADIQWLRIYYHNNGRTLDEVDIIHNPYT
jgi:hypothetical protein